jgi:hypothetical protein
MSKYPAGKAAWTGTLKGFQQRCGLAESGSRSFAEDENVVGSRVATSAQIGSGNQYEK